MKKFKSQLSNHNVPPGSSENPCGEALSAEFDGTGGRVGRVDGLEGWTDGTGYQKCPLNFFILCGYIDYVMSTCIRNKNCQQHSYGFQTFMSSWGSWSKISKLRQVGGFSFFGYKSRH